MTALLLANLFENPAKLLAWAFTRVYQLTLSEMQPDVCNYNPSCSRYGASAVRCYGCVGALMAADRLLRCNPGAWEFLGEEYTLFKGKLHDEQELYYIFKTPRYPEEVVSPW